MTFDVELNQGELETTVEAGDLFEAFAVALDWARDAGPQVGIEGTVPLMVMSRTRPVHLMEEEVHLESGSEPRP